MFFLNFSFFRLYLSLFIVSVRITQPINLSIRLGNLTIFIVLNIFDYSFIISLLITSWFSDIRSLFCLVLGSWTATYFVFASI